MIEGRPSVTAERAALARAAHQVLDRPLAFPDPFAFRVLEPGTAERIQREPAAFRTRASRRLRAMFVVRSRIAEDALAAAVRDGVRQYVVLGAGLDTFAYRNPHEGLRVFEVDHPSTQAWKHERLRKAGIDIPRDAAFVPIDFERERLTEALARAGHDARLPTFFSWLGVVLYVDKPAVHATLAEVARLAGPVGGIVFDYAVVESELGIMHRIRRRRKVLSMRRLGEPWRTFFSRAEIEALLRAVGFQDIEEILLRTAAERYMPGHRLGLKRIGRTIVARHVGTPIARPAI